MAFSGTLDSDFLKLSTIKPDRKSDFINYSAADFDTLRDSMIEYVKAVYPEDFNNFYESDMGIMLVELVAYMGSVMSYKGDALANENTLPTVKTRDNMAKLLELIGVRLKGPSSASAKGRLTWNDAGSTWPGTYTFTGANRTVSVASPEDGGPVSYTVYKTDSAGVLQNIDSTNDSFSIGSDAEATGKVALVEGAYQVERGSFGTSRVKTITLTQSPVIEKSIRVFVDGTDPNDTAATGTYLEVNKLFSASGGTDKSFEVNYDGNNQATVIFGDGAISQNPPHNGTFTVTYRVGGGSRGNLVKDAINAILSDDAGNSWRVENTTVMSGGTNSETLEHARRYAPYTFKSQDRLVTLDDYVALGNSFISSQGTRGKVTAATRDAYSSANIIDVYVLENATDLQLQKSSPTFKSDLLTEIDGKKMITDYVVVNDGLARTLDLTLNIRVDRERKKQESEIKRLVSAEIINFFDIDKREFGDSFLKVELERKLFQLPQVRFATIDNIPDEVKVDFNEVIQLNNFSVDITYL